MDRNDGGPAVEVPLLRGGFALVSAEDADRVLALGWRLAANGYAVCRNRAKCPEGLLHRFVARPLAGMQVHHVNGVKTDCRRENLCQETPTSHQKNHHSHVLAKRNVASRVYPTERACLGCGVTFTTRPSHRGRDRYCTRPCGNKHKWSAERAKERTP